MMTYLTPKNKIIVLIDAENTSSQCFLNAQQHISDTYDGSVITYHAIADFSKTCTSNVWKNLCFEHFIEPVHFFSYGNKGNQSDFSLSCYAVSLLDSYDHLILMSNDLDFVSLLLFLRNKGIKVTGIGENPSSLLIKACEKYIVIENDREEGRSANIVNINKGIVEPIKVSKKNSFERHQLLKTLQLMRKDRDGYVPLGRLKKMSGIECDRKFSRYVCDMEGFILSTDHQKVRLADR